MPTPMYVPVLKAKAAEIAALQSLPPGTQDVLPLFEVQAVLPTKRKADGTWDKHKSAPAEVTSFLDLIQMHWNAPLMVDISRVAAPTMRAAWWALLRATEVIRPTGAQLIPVVALDDPSDAITAAAAMAAVVAGAAVRLPMPLKSTTLAADLSGVAAQLGLPLASVAILIDWGNGLDTTKTTTITLDDAERATSAAIAALPSGHGPVATLGTPNTSKVQQAGYWTFTRREWWLWLRARSNLAGLWFGDYALFAPSDPVQASPQYGYLVYSSGDQVHIWREARPAAKPTLGGAFKVCCQKATSDPAFCGRPFSPADERIDDIATGTVETRGDARTWRAHALTHHFYLVRSQMASPPPAPPAGTV